jgi:hypothetical protein
MIDSHPNDPPAIDDYRKLLERRVAVATRPTPVVRPSRSSLTPTVISSSCQSVPIWCEQRRELQSAAGLRRAGLTTPCNAHDSHGRSLAASPQAKSPVTARYRERSET